MAHQSNPNDTTRILSYIIVALIAFSGGYLVKHLFGNAQDSAGAEAEQGAAAEMDGAKLTDSDKIPVGDSPVLGPENAPVTIVEFSDFQCPFCKKGYKRMKTAREEYPDKIRIVFKQFPLGMHEHAKPAARAALAAREQGDEYFWEMHDRLFENQGEWKNGGVQKVTAKWAEEIDGLDAEKFKKDLENNADTYDETISTEMSNGKDLGVQGTPHFFINGKGMSGAQPFEKIKSVIESELENTKNMLEGGVAKKNLYKKAVEKNQDGSGSNADKGDGKKGKKKGQKVEYVPVDDGDPTKGASEEEALVTFVEFSDFQCPFCNKAMPTLDKLRENYGDKVRFVFKHRPLKFHKKAEPAAKAAYAAKQQGKFWEIHGLMFENQKKIKNGDEPFVGFAEELGLNVEQFKKDMNSEAAQEAVDSDTKIAQEVGANGTPNFWVNGVNVVGAQPYKKFESVVERQIERAQNIKDEKGLSGDDLYKATVELNKEKIDTAGGGGGNKPKPKPKKDKPKDKIDMDKLEVGNSPTKGPKDAPIKIYEFSDFECPYCGKAHKRIKKLLDEYGDKIRLVHKHYPLPFHDNAMPAAKAAIAAQKQGKFWNMYDVMFENQDKVGNDGQYEKWARQIGLDVEKFKKDMENVPDSRVQGDMSMGKEVGVKGTPAFFINGNRLVGAQPYNKFKSIVEGELE